MRRSLMLFLIPLAFLLLNCAGPQPKRPEVYLEEETKERVVFMAVDGESYAIAYKEIVSLKPSYRTRLKGIAIGKGLSFQNRIDIWAPNWEKGKWEIVASGYTDDYGRFEIEIPDIDLYHISVVKRSAEER